MSAKQDVETLVYKLSKAGDRDIPSLLTQVDAKQAVETLVYKLSKAGDRHIPSLLIQIEDLLEQHDGNEIRMLLWENEILSTITEVIKQDFDLLKLPWSTATKLATLLAKSCLGLSQPPDFTGVFLPLVVDSFMELANNIQGLLNPVEDDFRQCIECIFWMVDYSPSLGISVLDSPRLLTMLMTESCPEIDMCILKLLRTVLTQPSLSQNNISQDKLLVLFDEVMLKMTEGDVAMLQQIGADVIYQTAKRNLAFRDILSDNADDVLELLNTINSAPGAHDNVNTLLEYIAKLRVAETERALLNSSATKIQAQYRGFATRRKLQQHSQSIAKFQLKFREWITEKKQQEKVAKEEELDKELQTKKARQRRRQRLLDEANKLQTLPANKISSHQFQVRREAASKIQAVWRMFAAKKEMVKMRKSRADNRAAITIQRHYRLYRRGIGTFGGMLPPGLTADKAAQLYDKIQKLKQDSPSLDEDEIEKLVLKSQEMYVQYTKDLASIRRVQKRRENLCSQIADGLTHLKSAPNLESSTLEDAKLLGRCDPVILAQARRNHWNAVSALSNDLPREISCRDSRLKYELISNSLDMDTKFSPLTYKIQQLEL